MEWNEDETAIPADFSSLQIGNKKRVSNLNKGGERHPRSAQTYTSA